MEFARSQRRTSNPFTATESQWLRNRQICGAKFRREHSIPLYTIDLCCVERKLIMEIDGKGNFPDDTRRWAFGSSPLHVSHSFAASREPIKQAPYSARSALMNVRSRNGIRCFEAGPKRPFEYEYRCAEYEYRFAEYEYRVAEDQYSDVEDEYVEEWCGITAERDGYVLITLRRDVERGSRGCAQRPIPTGVRPAARGAAGNA
ncbi:MAG: DUF559 domain-containing protein [Planctomycetaceae bacterium]